MDISSFASMFAIPSTQFPAAKRERKNHHFFWTFYRVPRYQNNFLSKLRCIEKCHSRVIHLKTEKKACVLNRCYCTNKLVKQKSTRNCQKQAGKMVTGCGERADTEFWNLSNLRSRLGSNRAASGHCGCVAGSV